MALFQCPECSKEISDKATTCPNCGYALLKEQPTPQAMPIKSKKKKTGCFIVLIILISVGVLIGGLISKFVNSSDPLTSTPIEPFIDVMVFWEEQGKTTITEEKLIDLLGTPDEIEEWNYTVSEKKGYPIRTLYYEQNDDAVPGYTYSYHFNNGMIQRITIAGVKIPYSKKTDIVSLFNLKKYSNSEITDTGFTYVITNCNVRRVQVQNMTDEYLTIVAIDYGNIF